MWEEICCFILAVFEIFSHAGAKPRFPIHFSSVLPLVQRYMAQLQPRIGTDGENVLICPKETVPSPRREASSLFKLCLIRCHENFGLIWQGCINSTRKNLNLFGFPPLPIIT